MAKSIALAADASRGAALLLIAYKRGCRLRRLARRAPRPRSSTDLVLAGPNFRRDFVRAHKEEPAEVVGSDDEVLVVDREGAAGTPRRTRALWSVRSHGSSQRSFKRPMSALA